MPKSKDLLKQELMTNLANAMKSEDEGAIAQAFTDFADDVQQNVMEDVKAYQRNADQEILQRRGIHTLTQKEEKFYQGIIDALKSNEPRQAFTGTDVALPETVIDNVMQDIKTNHPLLNAITFTNTATLTKILVNKQGVQMAQWGALNSAVTKELSGAIGKMDLTLCKLTAYMPISKDMLEVGPQWMDSYIRETLSEAIALALETAIITGTGKDQPIGMDRNVSDSASVVGGVYPQKDKVVLAELSPEEYGKILALVAKDPKDETKARPVSSVIFVINPLDYFTKVMPASTVLRPDGTYANNVFPYPTELIQSCAITQGTAIIGLASKYFMGMGPGSNGGKLEFSDEFKFLDDERTYLIKLYGNGRPLDNNAFQFIDISKLTAYVPSVQVKGTVNSKTEAASK